MRLQHPLLVLTLLAALPIFAADEKTKSATDTTPPHYFSAEEKTSEGTVVTNRQKIDYRAIAGTLVVHGKGWDDAPAKPEGLEKGDDKTPAEASMFYVAYFKKDAKGENRPITFVYNGGPGSATVWLHMGAFGPRRIVTSGDDHLPAAPYKVVPNEESLLDASDLVFIDAPGAGFSRIAGPDKEKAFWGIDADGFAFAEFITSFLNKYGRWNSPKYLFGESYGTTRSAVLINILQSQRAIDFNGVILLSQILNFDLSADTPYFNPGVDTAYMTSLPTYAATAWYHHKLPDRPAELKPFLDEVEHFALTDYALALAQGAALPPAERNAIAEKLHKYTGLTVDYIKKADLRISGGEFSKNLQDDANITTGRIDTRFSGPDLDTLAKEADYDPFVAGIASAYIAGFNDYVRKDLKWPDDRRFKLFADVGKYWSFQHVPPGADQAPWQSPNVMVDLAMAMKFNPRLKVQLNAGYFDLATPFFEGVYEMKHLPIPAKLQNNISFKFYDSGHMVYAHEPSLKALHDNVADFIKATSSVPEK
jgi:carboxypeptidase C (cathepsin A)